MENWKLIYISQKIFKDLRLIIGSGLDDPRVQKIIKSHQNGMPLSKIFREKSFWNHDFYTNKYTLDPRPESELIIEYLSQKFDKDSVAYVVDLGTGTGALILSILNEFPNWQGIGIDYSKKALKVANKNLRKLGLEHRCKMIYNNWLENIENIIPNINCMKICVSNPPYILNHEPTNAYGDPKMALFTPSILHFYKKIEEKNDLFDYIIMEINHKYPDQYLNLFPKSKLLKYNGYPRCIWVDNN